MGYDELCSEIKSNNVVFAVIRFFAFFIGYLIVMVTYSDFKSLCLNLIIMTITISSDYLILLLTKTKDKKQFSISSGCFIISIIFCIFLFLGCTGFIELENGTNILRIINTSQHKFIYNFRFINNPNRVMYLQFAIICAYVFEYTGILERRDTCISKVA